MRIDIYTLLGLVKDGKAPKKIKTDTSIFKLEIEDDELHYRCNDGGILTFDYYIENNKLNNEVEIIEEPKKIEKIARCDDIKMTHYGELHKPTENEEILRIKFNELIDEINNLKREKNE